MKYILIWSFVINHHWIAGTAMFPSMAECLEAKQTILSYKVVPKDAYIECHLFESHKKFNKYEALVLLNDLERKMPRIEK